MAETWFDKLKIIVQMLLLQPAPIAHSSSVVHGSFSFFNNVHMLFEQYNPVLQEIELVH